ncbi:MAG: WG repeat-containing protein [Clostridia bacterium]|nr:WG repeat-containing protein [Clostridia bacterium]
MTWVRSGSRYGFIDLESRLIVPLILDEVRDYGRGSDGLYGYDDPDRAAVRRGGKWGFIDDTGAIAVDFIFDKVDDFESGYAYGVIDGKQWRADLQGFVSPHIRSRETPPPTFFFSGNTIHGSQLADLYFKRGGHDHFYKEYFGEWRPRMLFIYIAGRCTLMELFEHLDEGGTLTDGTPDRRLFDRTIPMLRDTFANNPGCTAQQKTELDAQIYAACEAYIYTYLENGWLR